MCYQIKVNMLPHITKDWKTCLRYNFKSYNIFLQERTVFLGAYLLVTPAKYTTQKGPTNQKQLQKYVRLIFLL